jgi:hypothetical protein
MLDHGFRERQDFLDPRRIEAQKTVFYVGAELEVARAHHIFDGGDCRRGTAVDFSSVLPARQFSDGSQNVERDDLRCRFDRPKEHIGR